MIEVPKFPAVRRMARSTALTQLTFVDVFICVAAVAVIGGFLEVLIRVALSACDGDMEPEEGVRREIVIEVDFTPLGGRVTLLASLAERAAVRVVGTMAAYTALTELLLLHNTRMACVTVQACMGPYEWEELFVVVRGDSPQIVAVAVAARRAQPTGVTVVRLVAAGAVFWDRVVEIAAAMTVGAADVRVMAEQREARLACVVELTSAPVGSRVAIFAVLALATLVNIVGCMTTDAFLGGAFVALAGVTGRASGLGVLVGERKRRPVVIEVSLLPRLRVMTGGAVPAQRPVMRVNLIVATDASVGSLAVGHVGRVTTPAGQSNVRVPQRKVRKIMCEAGLIEPRDVGVASVVL